MKLQWIKSTNICFFWKRPPIVSKETYYFTCSQQILVGQSHQHDIADRKSHRKLSSQREREREREKWCRLQLESQAEPSSGAPLCVSAPSKTNTTPSLRARVEALNLRFLLAFPPW